MIPTQHQIQLLQHALGVDQDRREPYRNYFLAGGSDVARWDAMVSEGWAKRGRTPSFVPQEEVNFHVTDAGRALAIAALPEPAKRTRYDDFLNYDSCLSFAEYLGIRPVSFDERDVIRGDWPNQKRVREYRMYRGDRFERYTSDLTGDWAPTKKEAKASYKAALRASKD